MSNSREGTVSISTPLHCRSPDLCSKDDDGSDTERGFKIARDLDLNVP